MLKKLVAASAVLAVSSTVAFAGAPYVGVGLDVNDLQTKVTQYDAETGAYEATSSNMGARGALLNLFAGYGTVVNQNIYLGGELFVNGASTQFKSNAADGSYQKFSAKNSYGISFIPGLMVSEHTMAYLRAGIVRGQFKVQENDVNTNVSIDGSSFVVTTTNEYTSKTQTATGGQFGLGIQTALTQNVDLRGEYTYTAYRSFYVNGDKFNPSTDAFTLGVVYKFG